MDRENSHVTGARKYRNDDITVYWKPSACVHASYCYRELIEVFDPGRRPWIDMNGATTERIIDVVNLCPTEALTWKWNDEAKNRDVGPEHSNHIKYRRPALMDEDAGQISENPVSVKVMIDGPIVVKGSFSLQYDGRKKEINDSIISLCRCGSSNHLPFCDGMHRQIGFEDK